MREVLIGSFVETIHGVNGILIDVRNSPYGLTAYIATADGRTFFCPITDFQNSKFNE